MKISLFVLLNLFIVISMSSCVVKGGHELYVSPDGRKLAQGTKNDPFIDLESVKDYVSSLREKGIPLMFLYTYVRVHISLMRHLH